MSAPEIGAMRHRVVLEAPERTSGDGGTASIAWVAAGEIWAAIEPVGAREIIAADGVAGRITHEVRVRYRGDITAAHRLLLGGRLLEIRALREEGERGRFLLLLCEERTP